VLGGGPSVVPDLLSLPADWKPACVISANAHGLRQSKFPVDLIVNVDKKHCETGESMQATLSKYGKPIVNKWSWADYRLPGWDFVGNSGLMAVALAAVLGAAPAVVTGLDMWITGRHYFHDASNAEAKKRRVPGRALQQHLMARRRLGLLAQFVGSVPIRPMSGPLLDKWPAFYPEETFKPTKPCPYRKKWLGVRGVSVTAQRDFIFEHGDSVRGGKQMRMIENEASRWLKNGSVAINSSDR
jgi:hypothetical protein